MGLFTPEKIDGYLGREAYDRWMDLQRRLRTVQGRSKINENRFGAYDEGLWLSVDKAERLDADYTEAMKIIQEGKKLDKRSVEDVEVLFETALDLSEEQNDLLDAMWAIGFLSELVKFPFVVFFHKASILAAKMEEIKPLIEKARRDARDARIQKGLDVVVTVVTSLLPELKIIRSLSVIEKLSVNAAKLTYDFYLGPSEPGLGKYGKSAFSVFCTAVKNSKTASDAAVDAAKTLGKGITYKGFYDVVFSNDEIHTADETLQKLRTVMKEMQEAYNSYINLIKEYEPKRQQIEAQIDRAVKRIDETRTDLYDLKRVLDDKIAEFKYRSPKAWRPIN